MSDYNIPAAALQDPDTVLRLREQLQDVKVAEPWAREGPLHWIRRDTTGGILCEVRDHVAFDAGEPCDGRFVVYFRSLFGGMQEVQTVPFNWWLSYQDPEGILLVKAEEAKAKADERMRSNGWLLMEGQSASSTG